DDMYKDAVHVVAEAGKASTSLLQRRLRIGYSRAARIIEMMEEQGIIGSADGSRPREVLISSADELTVTDKP
ncbi:MAG: DNA translocase FtsK, partial [Candidatus Binatia bacterium]